MAMTEDETRMYNMMYRWATKEKQTEYKRRWRQKHPETVAATRKKYRLANLEKCKARESAYRRNKYRNDLGFRLTVKLRNSLIRATRRGYFGRSTAMQHLGCDIPTFIRYIECQWEEGMTWENHGVHGWHIDHIRPVSSIDPKNEDEVAYVFHYSNMQPMWGKENWHKHAKWPA